MLIFEPIPVEWIEKLQSIKSKYLKETIGGKHWYIDQGKQFSIYPIDWHTTVSTNINGKYYSEGEYIIVFISGGKFVMISAYLTTPYNNWNEKNRLSNCLETVSEEDVKATILHCYNNFNKDIRNYE